MFKILIIGAGRSASSLIDYLLTSAVEDGIFLTVADVNEALAKEKIKGAENAAAMAFNATDHERRRSVIADHDLIISMLPASMHLEVVKDAIFLGKHVLTPSYITKEIKGLHEAAVNKGVIVINELGLDPGIDHMIAMRVINNIKKLGGQVIRFESFVGGLVAPESDDNPWQYKFTWNPRNVVIAGQGGTAQFIEEGQYKYIPYHKLFRRTEFIDIDGYGMFEGYANRDSLKYRSLYGLQDIPTLYRGTLRRKGFCRAWDCFVQLGLTDDSFIVEGSEDMTYREFLNSFLAYNPHDSVELKVRHYLKIDQDDEIWDKLVWLDLFKNIKIGIKNATPAQILQHILEQKWSLQPEDKDMIVMWNRFGFIQDGNNKQVNLSMIAKGKDQTYTAMSNTVGWPVGIVAKLIAKGSFTQPGVHLPLIPELYMPVLEELESLGIEFIQQEVTPESSCKI
ncbi:MAG: saccharopine dehydrogenase family protein [Luteibaculaceae bacterium]